MRLGIKGKQVLYVTSIVVAVVVILSALYLSQLVQVRVSETQEVAQALANQIYNRAREVDEAGIPLTEDAGLRSILASSFYFKNITFAAIVDADGHMVVADPGTVGRVTSADPAVSGTALPPSQDLDRLLAQSEMAKVQTMYRMYMSQGQNLEVRKPLLAGDQQAGAIRIGVSTLLIREELSKSLFWPSMVALGALAGGVFLSSVLAQLILRPIHVLRGGLTRLGQGEFGVRLDLDQDDEFGDLGTFFNTVSAQLSADRSQMAGQVANLESAVEHLEDAMAVVSPKGELLFANPAMRTLVPGAVAGAVFQNLVPGGHPLKRLFDDTLAARQPLGPVSLTFDRHRSSGVVPVAGAAGSAQAAATEEDSKRAETGDRLVLTHPINDDKGELVGVMLIARNLDYLSQVQSTLRYSRKLAALGRLSAGVAHEVKNPLNAMMIHLELLKQQFAPARAVAGTQRGGAAAGIVTTEAPNVNASDALKYVDVIAGEIRRLDEVVQGFLKFTRPEDLKLQAVRLSALFDEVIPIIKPEADRHGVELVVECDKVPDVNADPAMLRQAFLNLALNAVQAMPNGGTLRIQCEAARGRRASITFSDTGVGIKPADLTRIFELYYTTKPKGSGIGLSMVYRTVQMHDGEIEVQSTLGKGTTFKVLLPQA